HENQLARARTATSFLSRLPRRSFSTSRSYRACRFSQKRSDVPKYLARRKAVPAVIARFPCTISLIRLGETLTSVASLYCEIFSGPRNSSKRISPGCIGASFFLGIKHLFS